MHRTETTGRTTVAVDLRALVGTPTGIGYLTLSLLSRLARRNAHAYVGMSQAPPSHADDLQAAGVRIEQQSAPLGLWWQQLRLPKRLAAGDVDLFWSPLMTLPTRLPVPGVVTIHDLTTLLLPETHRLKNRLTTRPFLKRTIAVASRIVTDSESSARDIRAWFPESADRLHIVYPGIDTEFTPASGERIDELRRGLGYPNGYLLYVGTVEPRKNLKLLLDVWEELRRDDPDFPPLVVAGPYGWGSSELVSRIERLEGTGLSYFGHAERSRLVELFQAATAFVYPSLYEGFGLPPAEALACGIPTVVSDRSSLPEVVGDAGLLFDPGQPSELADALRRLLGDPGLARDLSRRAVTQAATFSWDKAAAEMEEVFALALQ